MTQEYGEYQQGFSRNREQTSFNSENRIRKAKTMLAVLRTELGEDLSEKRVIDIGASTGFIANSLADHFKSFVGIDIDEEAIAHAKSICAHDNLEFKVDDAMNISFADESFDIAICSHIYEHVPNDERLMSEIARVLVDGGVCYFTAGNRFQFIEPHYHLPLLSVIPQGWAHYYLRATGKGAHYYERHRSYWDLLKLVRGFERVDYTHRVIAQPTLYETRYMIRQGSLKQFVGIFVSRYMRWLVPTYIWLLKKRAPAQ
jgi:2-polyprenyl-3-methyl-5-hydroxy-6-metoxy-1,4-benzoquinol methylase